MKTASIVIITLIIISCSTNRDLYRDSELNQSLIAGKVITEEGLPLEGVNVALNSSSCVTDINGRFFFNDLLFGKHILYFEKQGYTKDSVNIEYSFKNRKLPFIKVKLFSYNYLLADTFELLKQNKNKDIDVNITKLNQINPEDESLFYLKAIILYKRNNLNESLKLFENLAATDRKNIYYILPLLDIYDKLEKYKEKAELSYYIGKNFSKEYIYLIKTAGLIYKNKLNNLEIYNRIQEEYPELFTGEQ